MGAGTIIVTLINGKVYLLFGKERDNDANPGYCAFSGGTDKGETQFETAIRETAEELTGFLGDKNDIRNLLTGKTRKKYANLTGNKCKSKSISKGIGKSISKGISKGISKSKSKGKNWIEIDFQNGKYPSFKNYIFPLKYDPSLTFYYNNNQRFLQKKLSKKIINSLTVFEKTEIKWFPLDTLEKHRHVFRKFFRNIIDLIIERKDAIAAFAKEKLGD